MKMILQKIAAWLYGMVISVRNTLFDKDIFKGKEYDIPVICIGNITAGGTGKTPMVELVVSHFSKSHNVAVLSRGYKRKTHGYRVVDGLFDHYSDVGDEPLQIKRKFPNVPVVVCERRTEGIERIMHQFPEVNMIIMDDGFQHRWVKPYLNIVMIDFSRPVDKDSFMPNGQLRDSIDSLDRANIFVFTKCPENLLQRDMSLMVAGLKKKPSQATFFTRPRCKEVRSLESGAPVMLPDNCRVIAMSGIGNNDAFFRGLSSRYNVVGTLGFEDHYQYRITDAELLTKALEEHPEAMFFITTEKDAVKLSSLEGFPEELRNRIFYECIGMEFVPTQYTTSAQIEQTLYALLDNEIKRFNDDAHIRGC
ncbi:MAG: tetraacyldisaccharide 4'-kinase [Alistipes sp.]|nr:tetraacyldisaccharide 4'-kinase [Alistipes sp.]